VLSKVVIISVVGFLLALMPASFTIPSQFKVSAIVTTLGMDMSEQQLEVTAQFIKPQSTQGFGQKFQQLSGKGKDINSCFEQIEMQIGRTLVLAHCSTIVLSDDVCQQYNMLKLLDGMIRNNELGTNSLIIHTQDKAKDVLSATAKEELISQDLLVDIASFDTKQLYSERIDMFSFFDNSISPCGTAVIPSITLKSQGSESEQKSGESAGGGESQSGGDSQNQSSGQSKSISNKGDVCVFVNGDYIKVLNFDDMKGFNWMDSNTKQNIFTIEGYSKGNVNNATIQFKNLGQSVKFDTKISNNRPIITVNVTTDAKIIMLVDKNNNVVNNDIDQDDELLQELFQQLVSSEIAKCMQISRENGFDKLNFYHMFEMADYRGWQKFLDTLPDRDSYMQYIIVDVKARLIEKSE